MVTYAIILTLAPTIRHHTGIEPYQFGHWLGLTVWGIAFSFLHHQSVVRVPKRDPYLLPIVALLNGLGLMTIWRLYPELGIRQTAWIALSTLLVYAGFHFPAFLTYLRRYKYIWLSAGLLLTALTIFFGASPSGEGPTLWLQFFGFYFQPSELLKLLLIAYLAGYFTDRFTFSQSKFEILLPNILVIGTALLLLVFQRDLGTASIFLLLYLCMLFTSRGEKLIVWFAPILVVLVVISGYFFVDIVRIRIDSWLQPFNDPAGSSYQIIQSWIGIAEGGLIGTGPGLGSPTLIPVSVSDFIFSAIAEEMGLLGAMTIILLIVLLLYRGVKIALRTQNSFHRYLTLGLIFYLGLQSILIIGGNIGFLPLTGVTLPFVSYGGSSLLISFSALLILLIISHQASGEMRTNPIHHPRFVMVSHLLIIILLLEIIATSLVSFWFNAPLVKRPENPRWIIDDRFSPRGDILDRNNQVIITITEEPGNYSRVSNHVPLYPIIGYTNGTYGQTGIEASMFPYLRGHEGYPFLTHFWHDLIYNQPPEGLDVRLTIDLKLQKTADALLERVHNDGSGGTAILMNASSGEILAMASHPYFDAADLELEWEHLVADQNAPLINRAAQGIYPPGATLLPFVISSQIDLIEQYPEPLTLLTELNQDLTCAQPVNKSITWETLIASGCQSVQFELASMTGLDSLLEFYQTLGFFSEPVLNLNVAQAKEPSTTANSSDFFLGKGTFNISPLQMALAASALSNEGIRPGPRIVNAYQDPDGVWTTLPKFSENVRVMSSEAALHTTRLLKMPGTTLWQVTAVVLSENDQPISWFVAGTTTEWQGQPIVVIIALESDSPQTVEEIGSILIREATTTIESN